MKFSVQKVWQISFVVLFFVMFANAQSRNSARTTTNTDGTILSVVAARTNDVKEPIKPENLYLYENGIEQKIKNFSFDPSPARIVLLVDNSQTVPADIEKLKKATMEFAYEIFDGDQLFVIGYDEKAEIVQEWTDDAKKLETSLATFRKQGNPYLFDALDVTIDRNFNSADARNAQNGSCHYRRRTRPRKQNDFRQDFGQIAKSEYHRLCAANSRPNRRRVSTRSAKSGRSYYKIDGRHGREDFSA